MPPRRRPGFDVFLDADELGPVRRVGTLYPHESRTNVPIAFEYDKAWLESGAAFMLDPRLELWGGDQYPPRGIAFNVFLDSAPDRWGRVLMERREATQSRAQGRPMRRLGELDFLLGVQDETRTGALRFKATSGGPYLDHNEHATPPLTSLAELAAIVLKIEDPGIEEMPEYEKWLALLVAPGTSVGGARPKASFTHEGSLWIAKFPARDDRHDVGAWEFVVHELATSAGISVPRSRLERFGEHATFCVSRFDRTRSSRRMFVSALTLLDREDSSSASYLDIAEAITVHGAEGSIEADLEQLFRRVVFNILIANRDDHLRNHGFIRVPSGWRLAPAYDMNPNPFRHEHVLTIDGSGADPDVTRAMETAELYRLTAARAKTIADDVRRAVATWQDVARRSRLGADELAKMRSLLPS